MRALPLGMNECLMKGWKNQLQPFVLFGLPPHEDTVFKVPSWKHTVALSRFRTPNLPTAGSRNSQPPELWKSISVLYTLPSVRYSVLAAQTKITGLICQGPFLLFHLVWPVTESLGGSPTSHSCRVVACTSFPL